MNKYEDLRKALERAKVQAEQARQEDDGGTCNFDSPTIDYRAMGMQKAKVIETIKNAGLTCFDWTGYYGKVYGLVICGMTAGQGNCRTAMAEAFCTELINCGIKSSMYYQMD
jgi:hypothetical protein